tara:strand:+ start:1569 stop:1871 length:303 start_codon:yes stop_codon:yes gene_type:complete
MNKVYNWDFMVYLIIFVLSVMTWGLWDNGGNWWIPFTILFLFFGFYCDFLEQKALAKKTLDDDNALIDAYSDITFEESEEMIELAKLHQSMEFGEEPGIT